MRGNKAQLAANRRDADSEPGRGVWIDASLAAALFAVDPVGTGGVCLRARAGPVRDEWVALMRSLLPDDAPLRRVPLNVGAGRLLGGLDLAATLRAGRPMAERGLLADADGGVVLVPSAERMSAMTAAHLCAALDGGELRVERDGLALRVPARFGVVLLDEGLAPDERPPTAIVDRLGLHLDLGPVSHRVLVHTVCDADDVAAARRRLPAMVTPDWLLTALCETATALGIGSVRGVLLALAAARAAAALAGRQEVTDDDGAVAARLVLAPRATVMPDSAEAQDEPSSNGADDEAVPPEESFDADDNDDARDVGTPGEMLLAAARAALPPGLLEQLNAMTGAGARVAVTGKAGAVQLSRHRGRPAGVRPGEPRDGARLNVLETLRAAVPRQRLRAATTSPTQRRSARIAVRREDFRVTRFKHRTGTTTVFVVDASGSTALNRLAEAKGAIELLLADCYVRRDQVALVAFRGEGAELLLPPTRSLVRAKRELARLPGGGATPLAAGIEAALPIAEAARRRGETPLVILLTDGRANIARDGSPGRPRAMEDATAAARALAAAGVPAMLVDTSPKPRREGAELAQAMGARYLALPYADASTLSGAVRAAAEAVSAEVVQ